MRLIALLSSVLTFATLLFCAEEQWKKVDEGFQFNVPPDWNNKGARGIDSHVGKYQGRSAYLEFDELFGLGYTEERSRAGLQDLKNKASHPKLLAPGEEVWLIDGRVAHFTCAKVDPKIFGKREYTNVASIFVPYEGKPGYLAVYLFYENEEYAPIARQILQSFRWPKKDLTKH